MEDRTKEEKIQIIRALVNDEYYMGSMTEEDIDDMMKVVQSPVRRIFNNVYKRVKEIVEQISEEVLKQVGR